ncbi:MAG TPA: glycosyltransferase family 39 protein, partial [Nitrososphaerales archaeon]|nr:glycosyltransferase family 39 protein [Nitrososphaerales archaeon]
MNSVWATDHATSFVQLDYALLVHHSVALGQLAHTPPSTVDNFQYGGQTYSALAPGSAFLALPFLAVAFAISGTYTAYGPALFWSETFVSAAGAIATLLLYEIARMYFRRSTSILLGLAFAFSTILWPFATFFFQSDVSAMLVLASVFFALKASRSAEKGPRLSLACGLAAGLAFTTDYVDAVVIPVLLLFLIFRRRETGMSVLVSAVAFCLGTLPGLAAIGAYNSAIFGTPFMFTESAYVGQSILAKFSTPLTYGLALNTVSLSRGVFIFAPFTLLGVLGYVDAIRGKEKKAEMLLFL